jgi:hypothetical protein
MDALAVMNALPIPARPVPAGEATWIKSLAAIFPSSRALRKRGH